MLSAALTIDLAMNVLDISQKLVLSKLPIAKDAAFDSHADEHNAQCHPETRVALRQDIMRWADDPHGKCIFWLSGIAGDLGASFFFKRGEQDRGNAARLFTTIASRLVYKEPSLATYIRAAIDADPAITEYIPNGVKRIILVIDALDECERDGDIRAIIYLLSQAKTLTSVQLRCFVTSRPELPIRLGFNDIRGKYHDLILHDLPKSIIEHDITAFLNHRLTIIKEDYNALLRADRQLPAVWPGSNAVRDLVQMAVPLFIFAATICRFIEDPAWSDPAGQLQKVLEYRSRTQQSEIDKLDATYRPILDQLLRGTDAAKRSLANEFRIVVGSIVLLAEPLSISSLARLLDINKSVIDRRLDSLHSVLSVPASTDAPIRMFHLSFRDFLIDPDKRDNNPFWVDERATHERIAIRCLELLLGSGYLRKDIIFSQEMSGLSRADIDPAVIELYLPADVRHQAYSFLKSHFLYWLEALSLLGKISDSITMIKSLQALISVLEGHSSPVDAIAFSPDCSILASASRDRTIRLWDTKTGEEKQILKGHSDWVDTVAFSPDGSILVSASHDRTIRLWDVKTGEEKQVLEGHSDWVDVVAFSPDGLMLVSASHDQTIRLWDIKTGEKRQVLKGHSAWDNIVTFSPDGLMLASASSDRTIRLWNMDLSEEKHILKGHRGEVIAVAFSPDSLMLASASNDRTIWLWDAKTGEKKQVLEGHSDRVNAVAFSPDGLILASASSDKTIRLWDAKTGEEKQYCKAKSVLTSVICDESRQYDAC
ncbi:hypothetical protein SAPIO_CDS6697 [Scedosporium apiospermum]|uniref:Nephrocystin 3-like N-terminal domain-containing protein n=1 Tax=Pseudallescheria apiosperma TaxID=563466 RepID=A0A084G3G8_PSEDA|nr:uncharacterized protein SAPIO_CDS6697 [Scedosporium apiospermum]KEZ41880.1 hypothetical protein SAPIO_CDS6697 [Scedosporium apiospermum]